MVSKPYEGYLKPTELCNFHLEPEIRNTAVALTLGLSDNGKAGAITRFVKEFKYVYGDWTVKASETLAEGEGMCSSKTNLLIALLRCVDIPARYRVFRVKAESSFQVA
jgi:transglutaminase-like putative cysteine protease